MKTLVAGAGPTKVECDRKRPGGKVLKSGTGAMSFAHVNESKDNNHLELFCIRGCLARNECTSKTRLVCMSSKLANTEPGIERGLSSAFLIALPCWVCS